MRTTFKNRMQDGGIDCVTKISQKEFTTILPEAIWREVVKQTSAKIMEELIATGEVFEKMNITQINELVAKEISRIMIEALKDYGKGIK